MRIAVHRGGVEADLFHNRPHHVAAVAARLNAMHAQTFGDNRLGGHAGGQAAKGVLKHHLHIAAQRAQG